jgi:hypothetical protein
MDVESIHGWFFTVPTCRRTSARKNSEASTSNTIWLPDGAVTCRANFKEDGSTGDLAAQLPKRPVSPDGDAATITIVRPATQPVLVTQSLSDSNQPSPRFRPALEFHANCRLSLPVAFP